MISFMLRSNLSPRYETPVTVCYEIQIRSVVSEVKYTDGQTDRQTDINSIYTIILRREDSEISIKMPKVYY